MKERGALCSRLLLCLLCLLCFAIGTPHMAAASGGIAWSQEELDFMGAHPEIHLGVDPTFIPYEFFDTDGVYKGIAADYIALISKATGLTMTVAKGLTWAQLTKKPWAESWTCSPASPKRRNARSIFFSHRVITPSSESSSSMRTAKRSNHLTTSRAGAVAVQANSSHHSFLMDYPTISLALYTTVEDALQAVSDGTEIAFVGNLSTSSYLIKKYGITNLRYITISSQEPQQLYFAVRRDWPVLGRHPQQGA